MRHTDFSLADLSRYAQRRTIRIDMTLFLKGLIYEQSAARAVHEAQQKRTCG